MAAWGVTDADARQPSEHPCDLNASSERDPATKHGSRLRSHYGDPLHFPLPEQLNNVVQRMI